VPFGTREEVAAALMQYKPTVTKRTPAFFCQPSPATRDPLGLGPGTRASRRPFFVLVLVLCAFVRANPCNPQSPWRAAVLQRVIDPGRSKRARWAASSPLRRCGASSPGCCAALKSTGG
jgi:hypothetical protein